MNSRSWNVPTGPFALRAYLTPDRQIKSTLQKPPKPEKKPHSGVSNLGLSAHAELKISAAFERLDQGDVVGELKVDPDRDAVGQAGHFDAQWLDQTG